MSLIKVGDAEAAAGRGEAALAAYRESLVLARRLRAALGDTPQVLGDVAFSLERMAAADAAPTADRRAAAQGAVSLRQRLADALPDMPAHRDRLAVAERLAASLEDGR